MSYKQPQTGDVNKDIHKAKNEKFHAIIVLAFVQSNVATTIKPRNECFGKYSIQVADAGPESFPNGEKQCCERAANESNSMKDGLVVLLLSFAKR